MDLIPPQCAVVIATAHTTARGGVPSLGGDAARQPEVALEHQLEDLRPVDVVAVADVEHRVPEGLVELLHPSVARRRAASLGVADRPAEALARALAVLEVEQPLLE